MSRPADPPGEPDAAGLPAASIDEVLELLRTWGAQRYDEDVTQLEHARQTAAHAVGAGAAPELVAAALLHDVGHLLHLRDGGAAPGAGAPADPTADRTHEARGARWLGALFPPSVTGPVALHVAAKRYRVAVDPAYAAGLSAGSVRSLALQGGPMDDDEIARFERHPAHAPAVALRGWDDAGKVREGIAVADLESYRPLLEQLARPVTARASR